jgi:hypothetical protein
MRRSDAPAPVRPRPATAGRAEAGSAYLIVLLALVVLTLLGLTLALMTQSELQIGANERLVQRVFYAADTGIGEATARVLVTGDYDPKTLVLRDPAGLSGPSGALTLGNKVEVSRFLPILDGPCDLCQINQGSDFSKINHAVTATATRTGATAGVEQPLASKTLAVMIEIQPWQLSIPARATDDLAELEKIRF